MFIFYLVYFITFLRLFIHRSKIKMSSVWVIEHFDLVFCCSTYKQIDKFERSRAKLSVTTTVIGTPTIPVPIMLFIIDMDVDPSRKSDKNSNQNIFHKIKVDSAFINFLMLLSN